MWFSVNGHWGGDIAIVKQNKKVQNNLSDQRNNLWWENINSLHLNAIKFAPTGGFEIVIIHIIEIVSFLNLTRT